jgi:hypothetical protein
VTKLCADLEEARLDGGLSYVALGRPLGLSGVQVARICQGRSPDVSIARMAQLYALVGLDLSARGFPAGPPLRDAGHLALLARLRARLGPSLRWRTEVPVTAQGETASMDSRAWDATISGPGWTIGVEAETHVRDVQALERRLALKLRDGHAATAILLLSDTRHHRTLLEVAGPALRETYPIPTRSALRSLGRGEAVTGNGLVVL